MRISSPHHLCHVTLNRINRDSSAKRVQRPDKVYKASVRKTATPEPDKHSGLHITV